MSMQHKKENAPVVEDKRASVCKDAGSIPQREWDEKCRGLWVPFAVMLVLYVIWEVMA